MCVTRNRIREKLETLLSFFLSFITITKTGAGLFDRIHQKSEHTELPIIGWPLPNNSREERDEVRARRKEEREKRAREDVEKRTENERRRYGDDKPENEMKAETRDLCRLSTFNKSHFFEEDRSSSAPQDIRLQTNLHWLAVNGCMIETMMKFMIRAGEKDWEEKKKKKAIICVLRWCRGMKGKV